MQFKRQAGNDVSVNLTPLIDVVFLLLIFFMVSTTFKKESHINLSLPEATGEAFTELPQQIEIVISAEGSYAINNQSLVNNQLETLKAALKRLKSDDSGQPLIISADAMAPHQAVVRAMDAAGQQGFVNLSITTRKPEAGGNNNTK